MIQKNKNEHTWRKLLQKQKVRMDGALPKSVLRGVAAQTHELCSLFDDPHATWFPRKTELVRSMCEGALGIRTETLVIMPTQFHLVWKTLIPNVSLLSTTIANQPRTIGIQERCDCFRMCYYVHVSAQHILLPYRGVFFLYPWTKKNTYLLRRACRSVCFFM